MSNIRATEERTVRRRRNDDYNGHYMNLGVDETLIDPNYEYRWINDDRGRLEKRTQQDDWDFVNDPKIHADPKNVTVDSRVRRVVGTTKNNQPLYAYYCRKRKEWCEADRRSKHSARSERRSRMIRNQQDTTADGGLSADPKHTYIPAEGWSAVQTSPELRQIRRAEGISRG